MNILNTLKKPDWKRHTASIYTFALHNKSGFVELLDIFLEGTYRTTQKASTPLEKLARYNPGLFLPHLRKLILTFLAKETPIALRRNIIRLLQFIEVPPSLQGRLASSCFDALRNEKEPIAIKVFCMTVLTNICQRHPELKKELIVVLEDMLPYCGPGIASRGKKMLAILKNDRGK